MCQIFMHGVIWHISELHFACTLLSLYWMGPHILVPFCQDEAYVSDMGAGSEGKRYTVASSPFATENLRLRLSQDQVKEAKPFSTPPVVRRSYKAFLR